MRLFRKNKSSEEESALLSTLPSTHATPEHTDIQTGLWDKEDNSKVDGTERDVFTIKDNNTASKVGGFDFATIRAIVQTFSYYIVFLCFGIAVSLLGPTLSDLAKTSHTTKEQIGWVFTCKGIGGVLGSMAGGKLYDLFSAGSMRNANLFLAFNVFIMGGTMALMPIIPRLSWLMAVFVVFGMSVSLVNMGSNILCMWTWKERVTPIILAMSCIAGIGNFVGPAIVATGVRTTLVYWIGACITGISGVNLLFCQFSTDCVLGLENANNQVEQRSEQSDEDVLHESTEPNQLRWDNGWRLNWEILYSKSRDLRVSIVVGVALFGAVTFESCFGGLGYSFIEVNKLAKSKRENSLMTSTFWISVMGGRLAAAIFSALKIQPFLILSTSVVCCILSVGTFLLVSNIALPNIALIWLAIVLMGLGVSSQFPTAMSFPTTSMNNIKVTGIMSSIMVLMASSAEMIIPVMITHWIGIQSLFWVLLGACGLSVFIYSFLFLWAAFIQSKKA